MTSIPLLLSFSAFSAGRLSSDTTISTMEKGMQWEQKVELNLVESTMTTTLSEWSITFFRVAAVMALLWAKPKSSFT